MTSFPILIENADAIEMLTDDQAGVLFKALFHYANGTDVAELPVPAKIMFSIMKGQIDRMNQRYADVCEKNRENARKRWSDGMRPHTTACDSIQQDATACDTMPTITKTKREKDTLKSIPKEKELIDDEPVKSAWAEYREMRKTIKKPLTEGAIVRAKSTLQNLSKGDPELAAKILQQSVDHCWQGLFELKDDYSPVIKKPNSFFDFPQRNDDLDAMIRRSL